MGEVMKPLAGSPVFVDLMGKVSIHSGSWCCTGSGHDIGCAE